MKTNFGWPKMVFLSGIHCMMIVSTIITQADIVRLENEMRGMKLEAVRDSVQVTSGKTLNAKDVQEHLRQLEEVGQELQPQRLRHVKLKKRLAAIELGQADNDDADEGEDEDGEDHAEIILENRVYGDKTEQRKEELMHLERKIKNDVIVLAHVCMKHEQVLTENTRIEETLRDKSQELHHLKKTAGKKKAKLKSLRNESEKLRDEVGLLAKQNLLLDYINDKRALMKQ